MRTTSRRRKPYTGIVRKFADGKWGALCFEIGVITSAKTDSEALRQMQELIQFELERAAQGERLVPPASPALIREFMTCDLEVEGAPAGLRVRAYRGKSFAIPSAMVATA